MAEEELNQLVTEIRLCEDLNCGMSRQLSKMMWKHREAILTALKKCEPAD